MQFPFNPTPDWNVYLTEMRQRSPPWRPPPPPPPPPPLQTCGKTFEVIIRSSSKHLPSAGGGREYSTLAAIIRIPWPTSTYQVSMTTHLEGLDGECWGGRWCHSSCLAEPTQDESLSSWFRLKLHLSCLSSHFSLTTLLLYTAADSTSSWKELVVFRWVLKLPENCDSKKKKKGPLLWISVFLLLFPSTSLEIKKKYECIVGKKQKKCFKGWCGKLKNQDISDYPQQSGFPGWTHKLPRWISRNQYANISEVNSSFLNSHHYFCLCLVLPFSLWCHTWNRQRMELKTQVPFNTSSNNQRGVDDSTGFKLKSDCM